MIDEQQQDLASLYALGLLQGSELAAFEAALERDAALRELVRELRDSAAAMALAAPPADPSPELKARVLARLRPVASAPSVEMVEPVVFTPGRIIPWAIAASLTLVCAWLAQDMLATRTENQILRDQQRLAELDLRSVRQRAEAERLLAARQIADSAERVAQLDRAIAESREKLAASTTQIADLRQRLQTEGDLAQFKIATLASLAGNSPQALAVAVWNPSRQEGAFKIEKMPLPASDQDYELWVIDPSQAKPVSAGVFAVDADGVARVQFRPESPVVTAAKFAVSRERKGGAPPHSGPQGQVLMLSE